MWWSSSRQLAVVLWLCAGIVPCAGGTEPTLQEMLREAVRGGDYLAPGKEEMGRAEALFMRLARGATPAEVAAEAEALEMDIARTGSLVVVRESAAARRGRGFFVFRREAGPDGLLVPHGFMDAMTRDIGAKLFEEGSFSAAAWNTVPRAYRRGNERVHADLAHLPDSWFNAFARAVARSWPDGRILQLHGFAPSKRKNATAAEADMIISNGTRTPDEALRRSQRCLNGRLGKVLLYPTDIRELGGTTNAQGITLRAHGYEGFVHIEASRALRQRLKDSAAARAILLECLQP